jgi:hypothetical protein
MSFHVNSLNVNQLLLATVLLQNNVLQSLLEEAIWVSITLPHLLEMPRLQQQMHLTSGKEMTAMRNRLHTSKRLLTDLSDQLAQHEIQDREML